MADNAENENKDVLIDLTADVVVAYVSNNPVPASELPALIGQVHAALRGRISDAGTEATPPQKPAVPIKKSVTPDHIVCLEDGKTFKSLKRHLATHHGLSPEEYRTKWGLPADYPMTAPNYAAYRSAMAKSIGLGSRSSTAAETPPKKKQPRRTTTG